MKGRSTTIAIVVVCALGAAAGAYYYFGNEETGEVTVETIEVKKGSVSNSVTATGTIQPTNQVEVGTQVSGEIERVYVDYNSVVKQGQLLAELDRENLDAAQLQAQASYDNAVNEQNYLQGIYNRQKTLFDSKLLSQADLEQAEYNLNNAKSAVVQKQSDLKKANTNLSYARIYSPIDGVVLSRDVDEGQTVAASYSTPTLFTIARDLTQMQVEADVDEADIGQVVEGQRVSFTVDAYQGEEFEGKVSQVRLNPTTTSNVVTYTVVIEAQNPDLKLKPGLTAVVSIYTMELNDVLTIQSKAVNFMPDMELMLQYREQQGIASERPEPGQQSEGGDRPEGDRPPMPPNGEGPQSEMPSREMKGKMVWVLDNGNIRPQPVELGESDGVNIEVRSGLKAGDKVVYSLKAASTETTAAPEAAGGAESPFMPKPPGKRK